MHLYEGRTPRVIRVVLLIYHLAREREEQDVIIELLVKSDIMPEQKGIQCCMLATKDAHRTEGKRY